MGGALCFALRLLVLSRFSERAWAFSQRTKTALFPTILADLNHDGVVDVNDDALNVTNGAVAYFLPNIAVASNHCPENDTNGRALTEAELANCNDGQSNSLLNLDFLAPLKTLDLNCSNDAIGQILVSPRKHSGRVRLFLRTSDDVWEYITSEHLLNASVIRKGMDLGIDSRELVIDHEVWNGSISLQFKVTSANISASSRPVWLQLSPVLTHHHLQKVRQIVTKNETFGSNVYQPPFVARLDEIRRDLNIGAPLLGMHAGEEYVAEGIVSGGWRDAWAQDIFEPSYASIPGPNGTVKLIYINLRSAQSSRGLGRQVVTNLRNAHTGVWIPSDGYGRREINSFGNLETIPPHKGFPAGRIVTSKHWDLQPSNDLLAFLRAQGPQGGIQSPLVLESGWLAAGHVDEFLSFIPNPNAKNGWSLLFADVDLAIDVLEKVVKGGYGDFPAFSIPTAQAEASSLPNLTVEVLLADADFQAAQDYARKHLFANLALLKREAGIRQSDIIFVPALFQALNLSKLPSALIEQSDGMSPPRIDPLRPGEMQLMALYPAAINGIVIENSFVSPTQWGPIVNGKDVLEVAVKQALEGVAEIRTVDTFGSHHVFGGEVHCGSNTIREGAGRWWD